jgi:hypothetical protein
MAPQYIGAIEARIQDTHGTAIYRGY